MRKSKPGKTSFKPKPTASQGMPMRGKKSGKFANSKYSGSPKHSTNDGLSGSKNDRNAPLYNHTHEEMEEKSPKKY